MADNGYGAEENSKDFLLRAYRITPDFRTRRGGSGTIRVGRFIELTTPTTASRSRSSAATGSSPAATSTSSRCARTAAATSGSATSSAPGCCTPTRTAELLEAPIDLPGVRRRRTRPSRRSTPSPTLPRSNGFEGMALAADRRTLYPMLEGPLIGDPDQRRRMIYEYAPREGGYTGRPGSTGWRPPGHSIGDLTQLDRTGS